MMPISVPPPDAGEGSEPIENGRWCAGACLFFGPLLLLAAAACSGSWCSVPFFGMCTLILVKL